MSAEGVNTLKCANCNVVISETLAFIRNKIDIMDNESLIRICVSAFSEDELDSAKKLLFTSVKIKKIISRRKQKKEKDVEDMIGVFKTTEPDQIPIFVAYNLERLPPVCFDSVDVTKLLKELLLLRKEIDEIKSNQSNYVTKQELEADRRREANIVTTPLSYINMRRGGYLLDSGPIGLSHVPESQASAGDDTSPSPASAARPASVQCAGSAAAQQSVGDKEKRARADSVDINNSMQYRSLCHSQMNTNTGVPLAPINSTLLEFSGVDRSSKPPTMAEMVSRGEWKNPEPDGEWITKIKKKRLQNRFTEKMGTAQASSSSNFKAADSFVPLFISNVDKSTSESDICEYIKTKTGLAVKMEKINMKSEKSYNAFKVFVSKIKIETFLDDSLWPEGIRFRRFIHFKKGRDQPKPQPTSDDKLAINNGSNK